jgi:hypothetical protein
MFRQQRSSICPKRWTPSGFVLHTARGTECSLRAHGVSRRTGLSTWRWNVKGNGQLRFRRTSPLGEGDPLPAVAPLLHLAWRCVTRGLFARLRIGVDEVLGNTHMLYCTFVRVPQAIEEVARSMVEKAAEAAEAAQREATQWKEKLSQTTNRIAQLEQKVGSQRVALQPNPQRARSDVPTGPQPSRLDSQPGMHLPSYRVPHLNAACATCTLASPVPLRQAFTLESENKKLTRALVREVGEDVPLTKVLDETGCNDWKGRREQIIALRDQVRSRERTHVARRQSAF